MGLMEKAVGSGHYHPAADIRRYNTMVYKKGSQVYLLDRMGKVLVVQSLTPTSTRHSRGTLFNRKNRGSSLLTRAI